MIIYDCPGCKPVNLQFIKAATSASFDYTKKRKAAMSDFMQPTVQKQQM